MKFYLLLTLLSSAAFAADPCPMSEESVLHCTGEKNLVIEGCVAFPDTLSLHISETGSDKPALVVPVEVLENDWDKYVVQSTSSATVHTLNITPSSETGVYETESGAVKLSQNISCH